MNKYDEWIEYALIFVLAVIVIVAIVAVIAGNCDDQCRMDKMMSAYNECVDSGISSDDCAKMTSEAYKKQSFYPYTR